MQTGWFEPAEHPWAGHPILDCRAVTTWTFLALFTKRLKNPNSGCTFARAPPKFRSLRATLQNSGGPQAPYAKICRAFMSWSWTLELSPPTIWKDGSKCKLVGLNLLNTLGLVIGMYHLNKLHTPDAILDCRAVTTWTLLALFTKRLKSQNSG